jgi:cysteine desulfurase
VIYADYCATTPCLPAVAAAVGAALTAGLGNPGARHHAPGRAAQGLVDEARAAVADLLQVAAPEIIFTSGATEACNLAILGVMTALLATRPRICALAVEHPAVLAPLAHLRQLGAEVILLPVRADGAIDLAAAAAAIDERTALVCAMLVNNETGVLHEVAALAALAHAQGALVLCDATQAPARLPLAVPALGADLVAISAHKLYGPPGVGALWQRRGLALAPTLFGGGQERGLRPGSLNVPGIAGFGVAAAIARQRAPERQAQLRRQTAWLEEQLRQALPGLLIHGRQRAPGISSLTLPGLRGSWLAQLTTVAASAGSACSSGTGEPSHVLTALGVAATDARNSLRISLGEATTDAEVEQLAAAVVRGAQRLR